MTIEIGELLNATFLVHDDDGDPISGLTPTTIAASDPHGDAFAVTYEDIGGGSYFVQTVDPAMLVGQYSLFVAANDPGEQVFSITWDTDGPSIVITGIQRVQYVEPPHPADPDGTHDTRYLLRSESEELLAIVAAGLATQDYVDEQVATKADQTALDTLSDDVSAILVDTTDMATETWVGTQISGLASSASVTSAVAAEASARTTADAGKVDDFTQYYAQTISMGDGVNPILTTELSVQFCVPEAMTLHSAEIWGDVSGSITMGTSKASAGSTTFASIHAAAPLALAAAQVATPALTGWTTSLGQFDKIRTTVGVNAVTITRIWVCYRFTKARA